MRFFRKAAIYFFWAWMTTCAALVMTAAAADLPVGQAGSVSGVKYDKKSDTLTVHVQDMSLNEILQTVSAASGFKLSMQADLNRPVTMDFTAVPLDKAIHRLIQPNSSAMIYSKKEDGAVVLTSVKIFDKGGTPSSPPENLPVPRVTGRRNNRSVYGNADQAVGSFAGGGGSRNNKRNRSQGGTDTSASDTGSQASGAAGTTGSQGATAGGSSEGGGRRGR